MTGHFDLQGHRGARGLKQENTLHCLVVALDLMVTSIDTDIHLSKDGALILCHDEVLSERLARMLDTADVLPPTRKPLNRQLTLAQLRHYALDRNPDPIRFPEQNTDSTP